MRVHGAFVDDHEVHRVVEALKKQPAVPYEQGVVSAENDAGSFNSNQESQEDLDPLFDEAVEFVVTSRRGSTSTFSVNLRSVIIALRALLSKWKAKV